MPIRKKIILLLIRSVFATMHYTNWRPITFFTLVLLRWTFFISKPDKVHHRSELATDSSIWDKQGCTQDRLWRQHCIKTSKEYLTNGHISLHLVKISNLLDKFILFIYIFTFVYFYSITSSYTEYRKKHTKSKKNTEVTIQYNKKSKKNRVTKPKISQNTKPQIL